MLAFSAAAPFAIVILPRRYEFACGTFGRTSLGPYCIATISGLANLAPQPCPFNTVMPVRGPPCTGTRASLFPTRPPRVPDALRISLPRPLLKYRNPADNYAEQSQSYPTPYRGGPRLPTAPLRA